MKTADDLSRAMHAQMDGLHDDDVLGRVTSVHRRVRGVRRRRSAVVVGAAAVAVVGAIGVGAALRPGPVSPAEPALLGIPVPAELESRGFVYEYADGVAEADSDTATLRLEGSETPRLVSWATAGDDQSVVVRSDTGRFASDRPDFTDYVLVEPGEAPRISVTADEQGVALAVFELGDERPSGLTAHGVTWRQDTASGRLVGGAVGEPGEATVSTEITIPEGKLVFSDFCAGAPDAGVDEEGNAQLPPYEIEWQVQGEDAISHSCNDPAAPYDPGAASVWSQVGGRSGIVTNRHRYRPGDTVTLTVRAVQDGEPVIDPDIQLGLAAYLEHTEQVDVSGVAVPQTVETGGHTYRLLGTEQAEVGAGETWSVPVPASDERILVTTVFGRGAGRTTVEQLVDGRSTSSDIVTGPSTTSENLPVEPGVRSLGLRPDGDIELGLVFYELAD